MSAYVGALDSIGGQILAISPLGLRLAVKGFLCLTLFAVGLRVMSRQEKCS